jgi:hypothetical protein
MKVRIEASDDADSPSVSFTSPAGHGTAVWRGRTRPDRGDHDVELEVPGSLQWGRDVREHGGPAAAIQQTDSGYKLTGRALSLDGDVLVMDVGGGIVMLDVEGDPPADVTGRTLEVDTPVLELHPTGI